MAADHFSYFRNDSCEFYPCHDGADPEHFFCLFCWCPLYALGSRCGGSFRYLENGVKDCSACVIPHSPGGYEYIEERFSLIEEMAREDRLRSE